MIDTAFPNLEHELTKRLALAHRLADMARNVSVPLFGQPIKAENKGTSHVYDPVTQADKDVEEMMRGEIRQLFPDDAIIGEEFDDVSGTSNYSWTLDPIDGTRAFIAGVPVWSTLIAVSHNEQPRLGIIDLPALDQRYFGSTADGSIGSFCIDASGLTPLKTRACKDMRDIILGCTEPLAMFSPGERGAYEMVRRTARFSRLGLDAFGYCLLASGRMDVILEADLKPCDIRALIPVVHGAGGIITGWHGQNPYNGGRIIAAGDPDITQEIYTYLRRALD